MRSGAPHLPAAGSPVLLPSLAVLIFMLLLPGAALAGDRCRGGPALEPFERGAGMGYRTAGGEVVLAPRFAMALEFSPQCIAAVVDDRGWAYIDPAGAVLVRPHVVDNGPDPFRDGLARYSDDGKFGFIDTSARVVIEARFAYAEPFDRGYA
ncbi:MAG: WG repeat-containing protein, partial [Hyphomicrobiales bacterium]